ncbi:MAG TPA: condensation domain-containing protein [Pseudonocardiaceae bacterium]
MIPLSHAQFEVWSFDRRDHGVSRRLPRAYDLVGDLDLAALDEAMADVVTRHESLRTVFPVRDGVPYQRILDPVAGRPPLFAAEVGDRDLPAALDEAATYVFDLATEPPLRVHVLTIGERRHVLLLLLHHIAADGFSLAPLLRDIGAAYSARLTGRPPDWPPLPVQYADFTLWQRELLGDENDPRSLFREQLGYWREALRGAPDLLPLPTDHPRPPTPSHRGGQVSATVGPETHRGLVDLCRQGNATLYMGVQAVLATLLTRLGAGDDLPIGSAAAGRTDEALRDLVGMFVNTVVLRTSTRGNPTFREQLARVRETDLDALARQDLPFERVVEALLPARPRSHNPLYQVKLVQEVGTELVPELPGVAAADRPFDFATAKCDLAVYVKEAAGHGGLEFFVVYARDLFRRDTMDRFVTGLRDLVHAAVRDPDRPLVTAELPGHPCGREPR